jgi:hypothetical protein
MSDRGERRLASGRKRKVVSSHDLRQRVRRTYSNDRMHVPGPEPSGAHSGVVWTTGGARCPSQRCWSSKLWRSGSISLNASGSVPATVYIKSPTRRGTLLLMIPAALVNSRGNAPSLRGLSFG